jgi:hypothetical protein
MMIHIYLDRITARNKYVFRLIFLEILGAQYQIHTDKIGFLDAEGPKMSYGKNPIGDELFFFACKLLFETGIVVQELEPVNYKGKRYIYPVHRSSALPFDPFAAAFFMVSRYEEYLPHLKDIHGRFEASQSIAVQNDFIEEPVVNQWALLVWSLLEERYGALQRDVRPYSFVPTIDIDNAWAFLNKGFIRAGGGLLGDIFQLDFRHFSLRLNALLRRIHDPYDTYEYQIELTEKYGLNPIYFFLLGDFSTYDRNVPYQNKNMQSLIKFMDDIGEVGIHPSYASNSDPEQLKLEIHRLSGILHREVRLSRQHFLKLSLPETYQRLIECDITDDYTMGYAECPGFRAGIASPFFFYDLDLEIETSLKIHPFAIMDGTLRDYLKVSPEKASTIIHPLIDRVKQVGGTFIPVWHNESFAENERWKGWRAVYEAMVERALADA